MPDPPLPPSPGEPSSLTELKHLSSTLQATAEALCRSSRASEATAAHAGGDVDPSSMLQLGPMAALLAAGLCCGVMLSRAAASRCGRGQRARDEYGEVQPHVDGDGELVALEPSARSL